MWTNVVCKQDLFRKESSCGRDRRGLQERRRPEEMVDVVSFMHHLWEEDKGERERRKGGGRILFASGSNVPHFALDRMDIMKMCLVASSSHPD